MSWLTELLEQTGEYETPKQFWYWAGLCTISAIVKDNVWVERAGKLPVYLNVYVFLFAKSGFRKGPAIDLAKRLVKNVGNTRVISGRSSVEAIIEDLKSVQTDQHKKTVIADSCGFILASEFSSAIVRSEQALNILTDLYDRKYNEGEYAVRLIRTGKNILKSPIITLLGGINEAHFESFLDNKDISGGFLGRTFVIYADGKNTVNSMMYDLEHNIDDEKLSEHLRIIAKLKGPIKISEAAKKIYHAWYTGFYTVSNEDKTGTYERVGDSALKIAGLLCLAKDISMEINTDQMIAGIQAAEKLVLTARQVTFTINEEETISTLKKKVLKILVKRDDHKITRMRLLQDLHGIMNADDLNKITETLEQGGMIKCYQVGDNVFYEMTKEYLKTIQHIMEND